MITSEFWLTTGCCHHAELLGLAEVFDVRPQSDRQGGRHTGSSTDPCLVCVMRTPDGVFPRQRDTKIVPPGAD